MSTNKYVVKNLSLTLATIAESTTQAMVGQQMSLKSLVNMIFGNGIAFSYLLAEKGDVCTAIKSLLLPLDQLPIV